MFFANEIFVKLVVEHGQLMLAAVVHVVSAGATSWENRTQVSHGLIARAAQVAEAARSPEAVFPRQRQCDPLVNNFFFFDGFLEKGIEKVNGDDLIGQPRFVPSLFQKRFNAFFVFGHVFFQDRFWVGPLDFLLPTLCAFVELFDVLAFVAVVFGELFDFATF